MHFCPPFSSYTFCTPPRSPLWHDLRFEGRGYCLFRPVPKLPPYYGGGWRETRFFRRVATPRCPTPAPDWRVHVFPIHPQKPREDRPRRIPNANENDLPLGRLWNGMINVVARSRGGNFQLSLRRIAISVFRGLLHTMHGEYFPLSRSIRIGRYANKGLFEELFK